MYLVVIGWLYVTLMMALAEAMSTQGSVLGAVITFVLYGLLPMALVVYLMGTPLRRKAIRKSENEAHQVHHAAAPTDPSAMTNASIPEPDASGHAAAVPEVAAVPAVRKEDIRL